MRLIKSKYTIVICVILSLTPIQSVGCSEFTRSSMIKEKLSGYKSDIQPVNITNYYTQILFESEKERGLTSIDRTASEKYRRINPNVVLGVALVPGFFIHGLGHLYIGDKNTAGLLIAAEFFSILTTSISFGLMAGSLERGNNNSTIYIIITGVSAAVFFGSWIYDFIVAPLKASNMNKKHESSFYIYPEIKQECVSLKLAYSWR